MPSLVGNEVLLQACCDPSEIIPNESHSALMFMGRLLSLWLSWLQRDPRTCLWCAGRDVLVGWTSWVRRLGLDVLGWMCWVLGCGLAGWSPAQLTSDSRCDSALADQGSVV